MADSTADRELLATACRILVARGLSDGLLGHVSMRVDDEHLLVRCRGERERGLAATTPGDIRLVTMDGRTGGDPTHRPPNELPIHTEVLRAVKSAGAVVHAHPEATVALDLAGHDIRPILGALDLPGARLAAGGVPVYPRSVLIDSLAVAADLVQAMGDRPAVILRGHGIVTWGANVQQAVLRAIAVDRIARISLQILAAGGTPRSVPDDDLAALPDLGPAFDVGAAWQHEVARLGVSS